ncbi:hypothetical protein [Baekduia sp. Peel2402]|uniref:hypothetical protein n=1 Tax=Baekduia sp. Peel2402 TaxID=3458296 RepID=UPI00403EE41A
MRARALIAAAAAAATVAVGGIVGVAGAAFTNAGASTSATFAAAAEFPPLLRQLPSVLGAPQTGSVMHATAGTFSPAPSTITYTWLRCDAAGANCVANGGTGADYTPVLADVGKTLRVDSTPVNGARAGAVVRSEASTAVSLAGTAPSLLAPIVNNTPTIGGTATVGQTLTSATGTWVQLLGSVLYQWQRCDATGASCTAIAGATNASYSLVAADRGVRVSLRVTVTVLGLVSTTAITDTTGLIS